MKWERRVEIFQEGRELFGPRDRNNPLTGQPGSGGGNDPGGGGGGRGGGGGDELD